MQIDITKLLNNYTSNITIEGTFDIPKDLINDVRIISLKDLKFIGNATLDEDDMVLLTGKITGNMLLHDDITLEEVDYPFETDIEEILENNQNILDITDILWHNILIEIPSKVRKTNEDITLEGDGWRVISEKQYELERNSNSPFSDLSELLKTKEDK